MVTTKYWDPVDSSMFFSPVANVWIWNAAYELTSRGFLIPPTLTWSRSPAARPSEPNVFDLTKISK